MYLLFFRDGSSRHRPPSPDVERISILEALRLPLSVVHLHLDDVRLLVLAEEIETSTPTGPDLSPAPALPGGTEVAPGLLPQDRALLLEEEEAEEIVSAVAEVGEDEVLVIVATVAMMIEAEAEAVDEEVVEGDDH